MCKKSPSDCKVKIKCKCCIRSLDKIKEHDKIGLDVQEVDEICAVTDNIIIIK